MDVLLENLYADVMKRYWRGSISEGEALKEWEQTEGKDWDDICDAASLLAYRQGLAAFFVGVHLGCSLEHDRRQLLEQLL